jgi:hypothetical protein
LKTYKTKEVDWSRHRFGVGQRASDALVSKDFEKNLLSVFCSGKVLFIPKIGEIMAFYIVWS